MKDYLLTIIFVSIGIGIINVISPNADGISKFIKTIGFLIIVTVIVSPVSNALQTIDEDFLEEIKNDLLEDADNNMEKYKELHNNYLTEYSIDELRKQTKSILYDKFNIPEDECEVQIYTDYFENSIDLSEIKIILFGKSIFKNPYSIEKYISELFNCECIVLIN